MKKIYTLLLVFFSFLVGFTACDDTSNNDDRPLYGCPDADYSNIDEDVDIDEPYPYPDEEEDSDTTLYGCQYSEYSVNVTGTVKDNNNNPIKGIKLTYKYKLEYEGEVETTSLSDENGSFELSDSSFLCFDYGLESNKIIAEDIDGELNGSFETKEINDIDLSCSSSKPLDEYDYDNVLLCTGEVNLVLESKETADEDAIDDEDAAFIDEDTIDDSEITDEDNENDTDNNDEEFSDEN